MISAHAIREKSSAAAMDFLTMLEQVWQGTAKSTVTQVTE
jgi:hypothetical protein